jgi:thioredoxin reductase (NADPH)
MDALRKQAQRFGATLVAEDVTEVDLKADPRQVIVEGEAYLAKAVIIACKYHKPGRELLERPGGVGYDQQLHERR